MLGALPLAISPQLTTVSPQAHHGSTVSSHHDLPKHLLASLSHLLTTMPPQSHLTRNSPQLHDKIIATSWSLPPFCRIPNA